MNDEKIDAGEISHVDVETYRIAAEHAHTGWDDYAQRATELPVPDGPCGALPRHQGAALQRRDAQRSGVRRSSPSGSPSRRRRRSTGSIRNCARRASPSRRRAENSCARPTRRSARASCRSTMPGSRQKFIELVEPVLGARARGVAGEAALGYRDDRRHQVAGRSDGAKLDAVMAGLRLTSGTGMTRHQDHRLHRHRQYGPADGRQPRQGRLPGRRL